MINKNIRSDSAVSPVIAILLMIVVTVIIAAVVSGFAGSLVNSQQKVPTAQISGKLSLADGFTIKHNGGDALATKDVVITIKDSRLFGPDVESRSANIINKQNLTKSDGVTSWQFSNGTIGVTSFGAGDTALINSTNCNCQNLQPVIAPSDSGTKLSADGLSYTGGKAAFWALCGKNPANVGKTLIMEVSDKVTGKLISKADVPITS